MPKYHKQPARCPNLCLFLNDDGTWPDAAVSNALLFDIRRAAERSADAAELQAERQRQTIRVLERIDRRLAKVGS